MTKHKYQETLQGMSESMLKAMSTELARQQRESSRRLSAVRKELKRRKKA